MTLRNTLRNPVRVILILAALIIAVGIVINWDTDEFTLQTAIGQTHDTPEASKTPEYLENATQALDFQSLERANQAFINLVARTRPAVVQITTETERNQRQQSRDAFGDDFYRFFFGPDTESEPIKGLGSGVIVRENGYILTNNHVVDGVNNITVTLANGREYAAELIGSDPVERTGGGSDLALIKIDADGLSALKFGDSDALKVGEWVIAIGSPLGLAQTVTRGVVSAKSRSGLTGFSDFIQTDAPINRGNSGGALINIRGELVGINTVIVTSGSPGNIGIGFAISSNIAQSLMPDLIEHGKIVRGWLGITMNPVSHDLADKLKFESPHGVVVHTVSKDSPAKKAGIRPRDVIVEFDGEKVRDIQHLMHTVAATKVGKPVKLKVLRGGKQEKLLTVKLVERNAEVVAKHLRETERGEFEEVFAGISVGDLTPAIARRYGYASSEIGVVVTDVESNSDAQRKGIRPGFLIQEIEWEPIKSLETYSRIVNQLVKDNRGQVLLYVKLPNGRGGEYVTINVQTSDR
ncbi:hypothetical protein C6499_00960 [Candidatus Poribacteria bacterium]|nr:MAG: hypothetical protein C6499_00960 [Candidatus Poribacteria bacterium]